MEEPVADAAPIVVLRELAEVWSMLSYSGTRRARGTHDVAQRDFFILSKCVATLLKAARELEKGPERQRSA